MRSISTLSLFLIALLNSLVYCFFCHYVARPARYREKYTQIYPLSPGRYKEGLEVPPRLWGWFRSQLIAGLFEEERW